MTGRFDLLGAIDAGGVREVADESVFEQIAAALLDEIERRADRQHLARVHERDAVTALGLVHEMRREKDGDAVVAGEIDQRAPERVARDRIDAGSRFVENEDSGLVQHRHGKLQPLFDAEREAFRFGVGDGFQIVAVQQLLDASFDLVGRQVIELRVEQKILPNRQFAVERERLRHVADVAAHLHVVGAHRAAEQLGPAGGRREKSGQHLHRRRLAAAIRSEEAENFAAADAKTDVIHGDESAEPPRQSFSLYRRHLVGRSHARAHDHLLMQRALFFRHQRDEGLVQRRLAGFVEQLVAACRRQ